MTVSVPVAPQSSESPTLLFVTTATPQLSAPEKLTSQAAKAPLGSGVPSHSTVKSAGALTQVGSSLSSTVMVVVHISVCPFPSSTVQVTIVSPKGSTAPAIVAVPVKSLVIVADIQLSVNEASNSAPTIV